MEQEAKKGFKAGFTKLSIFVFVLSSLLAAVVLYWMNGYMTSGRFTEIPRAYFISNNDDYSSDLVYTLAEENLSETSDYRIYVIGGSSTRRSFVNEAYTEQCLADEYGEGYDFVLLSTSMLMNLENLLIVDNLPDDNGCVVLSLNVLRALIYSEPDRLPLISHQYLDYINHNQLTKEMGLFDQRVYNYVGGTLIKNPLTRLFLSPKVKWIFAPIGVEQYNTDYTARFKDENIEKLTDEYSELFLGGINEQQEVLFINTLLDIAKLCEEKNLDLLLLDAPFNVDLFKDRECVLDGETSAITQYRIILKQVADETDAEYADFIWDMGIKDEQYMDMIHLSSYEARADFTKAFVKSLGCFLDPKE